MRPSTIIEHDRRLLERAKAATSRAKDGSFNEDELEQALAAIVPFDVDKERLNKARSIIDRNKRPGSTQPAGQLILPGFNKTCDYEPDRLISDDSRNIVEHFRAAPRFAVAEVRRAQENVDRTVEQLRRKSAENAVFQGWALEQALAGRPEADLTWGNCVEEKGLRVSDAGSDAA